MKQTSSIRIPCRIKTLDFLHFNTVLDKYQQQHCKTNGYSTVTLLWTWHEFLLHSNISSYLLVRLHCLYLETCRSAGVQRQIPQAVP